MGIVGAYLLRSTAFWTRKTAHFTKTGSGQSKHELFLAKSLVGTCPYIDTNDAPWSRYNAFDDGDACCVGTMANSALYMHYPLQEQFKQNPKPTVSVRKRLLRANYINAENRAFAKTGSGEAYHDKLKKDGLCRASKRRGCSARTAVLGRIAPSLPTTLVTTMAQRGFTISCSSSGCDDDTTPLLNF
jgi:hypothetical protein